MEDDGAEGVDWDGLSLEVLEMIFRHLPVNDLLSCSVMSKHWKKAARDVLKRNRECCAHIKNFPQDIQGLNEMIASTSLMEMVSGLHIRNAIKPKNESASASSSSQQASSNVKNALKKAEGRLEEAKKKVDQVLSVQWSYLNLDMGRPRESAVPRDDASLLREVISATSGSLQKLVIGQERDWSYLPCNGNEYSKLTVIQLLNKQFLKSIHTKILSPAYAPKLEEISGAMMKLKVNSPADCFTMSRMKSLWLWDLAVPENESKKEAFGYISGLRQLYLPDAHCDPFEEDPDQQQEILRSWTAFVLPLVLRSLDTLEGLDMHIVDFFCLLKASEALKLPNLRCLKLGTRCYRLSIERGISALKQLNLTELCPNWGKVEAEATLFIEAQTDCMLVSFKSCAGLDQSVMPLQIEFDCGVGDLGMRVHQYLQIFNAVHHNIVKVRLLHLKNVYPFKMSSVIWDINSLEYLEISINRRRMPSVKSKLGLDALLCGINIEELLLKGHRNKKAQPNAVIVPIRPSLFNAKKLKELKITEDCNGRGEIFKRSSVIQITENLPVRHERELNVTFEGSNAFCNKLKQLRAFSGLSSVQVREN